MNNAIIIGNLTRDPETRETTGQNPTTICRFTVAVNDGYGERQHTSFIPVKVFGRTAENCGKFIAKGSKVCVRGRIETGSYQKQDGTKVYTTDLVANEVEFLSEKKGLQEEAEKAFPDGFEQMAENEQITF